MLVWRLMKVPVEALKGERAGGPFCLLELETHDLLCGDQSLVGWPINLNVGRHRPNSILGTYGYEVALDSTNDPRLVFALKRLGIGCLN